MLSLDRVVFRVRSASASRDFYGGVLGLPLVSAVSGQDEDGHAWLALTFAAPRGGSICVVEHRGLARPRSGGAAARARRFGFSTPSELDLVGWRRRLSEAAIAYREETCGDGPAVVFQDPDGVILEIQAPVRRRLRRRSRAAEAEARRWLAASA